MAGPVDDRPPGEVVLFLVVATGGAVGGLLRWALGEAVPGAGGTVDPALLGINVGGAFLLGLLPAALGARGRFSHRTRYLLAGFAGPGLLGGFTTLSAIALLTRTLLTDGRPAVALLQLGGTLACAVAAVALARRLVRSHDPARTRATTRGDVA